MDDSTFDRLTRAVGRAGSRRRLLGIIASLGLGGLLAQLDDDSSLAKRRHGRNRGHHPGKHKRNRKGKRKGGGLGGDQCGKTGSLCQQDSDCCTDNCFNFICAESVTSCGQGSAATQCQPAAKGCAGDNCCYGAAGCDQTCCVQPANQCNPANLCCAANCDGRHCGPDGCGAGGTCGSCPSGQTCNNTTGQCNNPTTCSAQNCPNGCCDAEGKCQTGTTVLACGTNGETCQPCPSEETCLDGGVCRNVAGTCTVHIETCGQGLVSPCDSNGFCTCDVTLDGAAVCRIRDVLGGCGASCSNNADCGPTSVCVACGPECPRENACMPLCSS